MLQIKDIRKKYKTGDLVQTALDGVSLSFRDNEFVAILGPSGSGKTTMLNIIGGLDRYDSGDLVINGISTKDYNDRDWDTYRNHSIGFVFQSYNLIPHQTILANVELALTISGISKSERRARAKESLEKVGLGDQIHKRPNQLSGGQMQRVAIARALVNNPDILLADEPTGALDTQTGIQVMELLKEVAQDRLVIMVTHNPDLAEQYATRIVRIKDGKVISDSDPLADSELTVTGEKPKKKASMSLRTALGLSANNLRTKKGRTIRTSLAGSIGIIGIALILALSSGVDQYISDLQRDTLSSYPITISSSTFDVSSLTDSLMSGTTVGAIQDEEETGDAVYSDSSALLMTETITSSFVENDLTAFKAYLDDESSEIWQYIGENGVVYTYDTHFDVYTKDEDGNYLNTGRDLDESSSSSSGSSALLSLMTGSTASGADNFEQMMPGSDGEMVSQVVTDSYDLLYGSWPEAYDEVVLVLDGKNSVSTEVLCQLGLITQEQYDEIKQAVDDGAEDVDEIELDYESLIGTTFTLVTFSDYYAENEDGTFYDISGDTTVLYEMLEGGLELRITGIIRVNDDAATTISAAVGYTAALTDYIIEHTNESAVITAQEADPDTNVLTGRSFEEPDDEQKAEYAKEYLSEMSISEKATMYTMIMYLQSSSETSSEDTGTGSEGAETESETGADGISSWSSDAGISDSAAGLSSAGLSSAAADETTMASMLDVWLENDPDQDILLAIYDQYLQEGSYEENMSSFGKISYDAPSSISIYTDSFEDKDYIAECITDYNSTADEDDQITYVDYVALLTSSITSMVNIISYVLIAFVAVSLIVSCIMISIITQISVLERTKEIGILRAIGASKGSISQVFNAETFIIGAAAGVLGIIISKLLIIPINAIIRSLTGNSSISAVLPWRYALILILISIVITVLSGLIPAHNASKKDPVEALRTE